MMMVTAAVMSAGFVVRLALVEGGGEIGCRDDGLVVSAVLVVAASLVVAAAVMDIRDGRAGVSEKANRHGGMSNACIQGQSLLQPINGRAEFASLNHDL
jgi:hypothetical protein